MTRSALLISKARDEALLGTDAGSPLATLTLQLADEYEIAIAQALRLEAVVHEATKDGGR
jgi:hypothetical protein